MRITYIHQHFALPEEPGGSRPWEFSRRLAADGHEVTLICGGEKALDVTREGVRIMRIRVPYSNTMSFRRRIASFLRFMVVSTWKALRTKADVVFASSTPLTVAVPGMIAAKAHSARFIFEVRDLWPQVPVQLGILKNPVLIKGAEMLEKLTYKQADAIIALSPSMRAGVHDVLPSAEVQLVPNSSDLELFRRHQEDIPAIRKEYSWGDEVILTYCGSFGASYDLEWAVRLAAELMSDECRFVLVGEGALSAQLRNLCEELGIDPDRILWGKRSKNEVSKIVAASDAVISTLIDSRSLEGNSLNKVFDALAAERPVFFNHEGWLADAVSEAGGGWKLARDIPSAAATVRSIIEDREKLATAGREAGRLGRTQFSRDELYARFREVVVRQA